MTLFIKIVVIFVLETIKVRIHFNFWSFVTFYYIEQLNIKQRVN